MSQVDTTIDAQDTSVSEVVAASTNEEAQATEADDTALEDIDISFDEAAGDETDGTEDSEPETQDTEPATEEESEEDVEQPEAEEPEESSTESKEDIKRYNAEMAKRRIAEREAREAKDQLEKQNLQRYLDDAGDDELERARRELDVQAHSILKDKAQLNADKLESGIERAVATIDLFRTGTPEVKEELARRLEDFEEKHVEYDKNGRPIKVTADVTEYLQKEAASIQRILKAGARTQSQAKNNAKARTDTLPTRAPREAKIDPDVQDFEDGWK